MSAAEIDVDETSIDIREADGKTFAPIEELENWEDNPREASDQEIDRLADEIEKLGFYKPIITTHEGEVLGGNMRLRALRRLGADEVWVSVVEAETDDEKLEYALSDNDRVGHYKEEQLADLLKKPQIDIDIGQYKVDFYDPQDMAQNMARAMDPDELLGNTGVDDGGREESAAAEPDREAETASTRTAEGTDDPDRAADAEREASDDGDEAPPRELENLGESSSTAMVQLYMGQGEKEQFVNWADSLKSEYGVETTSDVVYEAVRNEYANHRDEDD